MPTHFFAGDFDSEQPPDLLKTSHLLLRLLEMPCESVFESSIFRAFHHFGKGFGELLLR
jgi:hypothetical protein